MADLSQLLQSGLLNYSQPNALDRGLMSGDPSMQLGMQLLANSNTPGNFAGIFGRSMLGTQEAQQKNAANQMGLMEGGMNLQSQMQQQQVINQYIQRALQQSQGAPQGQGQSPGMVPQQPPGMAPSGAPSAPAPSPQAAPGWGGGDLSSVPIAGMPADLYRALSMAQKKDPLATEKEIRGLQLQSVQEAAKPQLDALDTIIKSDNPAQYVQASPTLRGHLQAGAQMLGLNLSTAADPNQAVRTALTARRNQLASQAQLGMEAPPVPMKTTKGALGSIYQTDPLTGKTTQVKGDEPLTDVVDPKTGLPVKVRASAAEGKQPFNQSVFAANNVGDQALQFAADTYRATGKFPGQFGRSPLLQAKVLNKVAEDAAAAGDSAGSIAARSAALKANGQALDQVTKQEAATTSYYNTLDKNLQNLQELSGKIDSSGVPLINKVFRAWQQGVSGDPEVAKYVTYMRAAEGEYAKIQSGSLGNQGSTDAARRDAQDVINKYMSKGQLDGVIQAMRGEGQNRLSAIREQKQSLMGGLSAGPPGAGQGGPSDGMKPPPGTPTANAKGWVLHHDAKGNWAYVSGDGKSFDPVK